MSQSRYDSPGGRAGNRMEWGFESPPRSRSPARPSDLGRISCISREFHRMRRSTWPLLGLSLLAAFSILRAAEPPRSALRSGVDKSFVDPKVRPQDDLFRHVNGKWLAESPIPPDRPLDGAFYKLRDKSEADLRAIIEETAARSEARRAPRPRRSATSSPASWTRRRPISSAPRRSRKTSPRSKAIRTRPT